MSWGQFECILTFPMIPNRWAKECLWPHCQITEHGRILFWEGPEPRIDSWCVDKSTLSPIALHALTSRLIVGCSWWTNASVLSLLEESVRPVRLPLKVHDLVGSRSGPCRKYGQHWELETRQPISEEAWPHTSYLNGLRIMKAPFR